MKRELDLHELCTAVHDKESFLRFAKALKDDRQRAVEVESKRPTGPLGPGPLGWENSSIEGFLESATAWLGVSHKDAADVSEAWRLFADFLYCGKIYE